MVHNVEGKLVEHIWLLLKRNRPVVCVCVVACRTVRDCRREDHLQHYARHVSARVYVCSYRRSAV